MGAIRLGVIDTDFMASASRLQCGNHLLAQPPSRRSNMQSHSL